MDCLGIFDSTAPSKRNRIYNEVDDTDGVDLAPPRDYLCAHDPSPRHHPRPGPQRAPPDAQDQLADLIEACVATHATTPDFTEAEMAELKRRRDGPFDPAPAAEVREFLARHRA